TGGCWRLRARCSVLASSTSTRGVSLPRSWRPSRRSASRSPNSSRVGSSGSEVWTPDRESLTTSWLVEHGESNHQATTSSRTDAPPALRVVMGVLEVRAQPPDPYWLQRPREAPMSSVDTSTETATESPPVKPGEMRLEVVVL